MSGPESVPTPANPKHTVIDQECDLLSKRSGRSPTCEKLFKSTTIGAHDLLSHALCALFIECHVCSIVRKRKFPEVVSDVGPALRPDRLFRKKYNCSSCLDIIYCVCSVNKCRFVRHRHHHQARSKSCITSILSQITVRCWKTGC